ncbi:unnamed protein product [Pedinophyceae sp. YPF-701]|nr:unnamed protein product [Pedinophyceae sp. YPF-701]
MPPKRSRSKGPAAEGGLRAEIAELVKSMPDADLPAVLEHLKKNKYKDDESPLDEELEAGAIRQELHGHITSCARMTNGAWHDCYEETDEECSAFYDSAAKLVNKIYAIGVKERRCVGRCHVALLTIADLTEELESVPLRMEATESWSNINFEFPLQTGAAGPIYHPDFMDRVRFVWRDLLRVAAGLEGGVTDLPRPFMTEGAAPLDQMIADALAYKCDVLNERDTGHGEECDRDAEGMDALKSFVKERRLEYEKQAKEGVNGSRTKKPRKPLPVELIPDPELREGARKLAEAVASRRWEDVADNHKSWDGHYECHDGRFDHMPGEYDDDDEDEDDYRDSDDDEW